MGIKCQIILTPPEGEIYTSGDLVTGVVKYSIDKPTWIPNISLFFTGKLKGKNLWKESKTDLKCKEVFVSLYKIITERSEDNTESGDYEYPFEFLLPKDLPSSFRNNTCKISYKISVEFMCSGLFSNVKKFQKELLVYGDVRTPASKAPAVGELTKLLFPMYKPVDLEAKVINPVVTAGENIKLNSLIVNEADLPVTGIKTKLVEEITYKYDDDRKSVKRRTVDRTTMIERGAKANSETKVYCVVPTSLDLFSIQHSKYFTREYKVNVTVTFPFPHKSASVDIPVVIRANNEGYDMDMYGSNHCCIDIFKVVLL